MCPSEPFSSTWSLETCVLQLISFALKSDIDRLSRRPHPGALLIITTPKKYPCTYQMGKVYVSRTRDEVQSKKLGHRVSLLAFALSDRTTRPVASWYCMLRKQTRFLVLDLIAPRGLARWTSCWHSDAFGSWAERHGSLSASGLEVQPHQYA
jgi:hypothetical protein